jgi:tetratricopeptide (TPR) repeat protein
MRVERRNVASLAALVASVVGLAWAAWSLFRTRPAPEQAIPLAEAGRFDEAEAIVRASLQADPGYPAVNLLLAQILLKRPAPAGGEGDQVAVGQAREALEHLDRIRNPPPGMRALIPLWRGKALFRLGRLDDAEVAWDEALRLDPRTADAGWGLLEIDYLEGRAEDARRLALRLHEIEPDRRDRVQLLLELVRQDAQPPAPGWLVQWFEPVVQRNPGGLGPALALGLALVRTGELDRGLELLGRAVESHPESPIAWEAWLTGLDDAGQIDELDQALDRLPPALAAEPRFARYRGRVAQERQDWKAAAREYRHGLRADPRDPKLGYRLARALRQIGATAEAEPLDRRYQAYQAALNEVRPLYVEANAIKTLGVEPHPHLYRRLADLRERMGLRDEAQAWYRLALIGQPDDPISRAALERLARPGVLPAAPDEALFIRRVEVPHQEPATQHPQ